MINYWFYALLYSPLLVFVFVFILILRDNRIHCFIIDRNHEVRRKKVNPKIEYFKDRNSIYMIPSDCVTLSATSRGLNPKSELYFVEDNPLPINYKTKKGRDPNVWVANKMIIDMFLETTSKPRSFNLGFLTGYLADPKKLLMLVFVLIIISAVLTPKYAPELIGGVVQ